MADMALCASATCRARDLCRRNEACPQAYPVSEHWQSWAGWHPDSGQGCPGFIDYRHDWRTGHPRPPPPNSRQMEEKSDEREADPC